MARGHRTWTSQNEGARGHRMRYLQQRDWFTHSLLRHAIRAILLLLILDSPVVAQAEDAVASPPHLQPLHVDVDGDQNLIEKDFSPGNAESDNLSHARRSTVYVGGVELDIHEPRLDYYRATALDFTTRASGFVYAYPTRKSMEERGEQTDKSKITNRLTAYDVWDRYLQTRVEGPVYWHPAKYYCGKRCNPPHQNIVVVSR